ncbi:integral membrane protein, putative [Theileria annulata]|uniref:Integral membrane protein, putative n=1 Tax=Theileria annulata TaxID=5874 RepID=Q4UH31_THEAN|nr:integral membrane protein, putative [Theileria annulata]CAI73608.1 integral membrane protein, putative [Theileria annulata]|eukprot:XP_954285.1 integral membrane protein, putative [Theileria annulata]
MTSENNNNCSSGGDACSSGASGSSSSSSGGGGTDTSLKQSKPFNLSNFGILAVFCIILSLSSSTYHNWPAIERSLVNDKVFQHLCTENEIRESIPEMYVCDKQRDAIGNLSLNIFLFEFIAYSIGGPLVDILGVYIVMICGFAFGFYGFILLYFYHDSSFIVKFSFCCWGMFGGLIIITSIHFARMFPQAKSLADGMMIFFENFASRFGITYYEGYGAYIIWGIVPSFILALSFMPIKIISKDKKNNNRDKFFEHDFKCLPQKLKCWELWANLVVFSIPVTSAMFYRKTFSAYFLNNPTLQTVFPFILLFVFLPIPFISALDQFISVHLTSAFLYILYILAFLCFFYRTRTHGLISMVLFCIAHSAEHQIMHYISNNYREYESTLMGISYSVVFVVGFSPKLALYTIISLLFVATIFSVAFQIIQKNDKKGNNNSQEQSSELTLSSLRIIYVIFWFIPFIFLTLSFKSLYNKSHETKSEYCICKMPHYRLQKSVTAMMVFYSFSFYYVCTFCKLVSFDYDRHRFIWILIYLGCFFIVSHFIIGFQFQYGNKNSENILKLLIVLFICKIFLFVYSKMEPSKTVIFLFSGFLVIYGYTFFLFIHMLTYYNFQITYVERSYRFSLIHWGGMFTLFLLFRFFYIKVSKYRFGYRMLWTLNTGFFAFFAIQLCYYFPYEMDVSIGTSNLPVPKFKNEFIKNIEPKKFCARLFSVALLISNLAILISFVFCWTLIVVLIWCFFNDLIITTCSIYIVDKYKDEYKEKYHPDMIKWFILPISSVSLALFVALFICRIVMSDSRFNNNGFVYVLIICSFVILSYYSNVSWFHTQYELQTCCCKKESGCECQIKDSCCCCCTKKCLCCICRKCCCCKKPSTQCDCCKTDASQCCCKSPDSCDCCKNTKCSSNGTDCKCCTKCEKCVCICLKRNKNGDNGDIIFCFFECEFKDVVNDFVSFFIGNTFGWLLFIAFFALSKEQNVFLSFR